LGHKYSITLDKEVKKNIFLKLEIMLICLKPLSGKFYIVDMSLSFSSTESVPQKFEKEHEEAKASLDF